MNTDRANRLLAALTPSGITANQAHLFWSCAWETADALLKKMAAQGLIWAHKHTNGATGYYRNREEAEACKARVARFARELPKRTRAAPKAAEIIIPPGLKITQCPPFEGDYRIQVKGPVVGGFADEWKILRGQP